MEATGATEGQSSRRQAGRKYSTKQLQVFSPFSDEEKGSAAACDARTAHITRVPGGKREGFNLAAVLALKSFWANKKNI